MEDTLPIQARQGNTDDDVQALLQQLEEIDFFNEHEKGKHRADCLSEFDSAVSAFQDEVQAHLGFLMDLRLAQSIGRALHTDGQAIAEIAQGERQAENDRYLAMRISTDDPKLENPPPAERTGQQFQAGPSKRPAVRWEELLGKSSPTQYQCCTCCDSFQSSEIVQLGCDDCYCTECLRSFFMRATKDETLFPPKCCRQSIPLSLIATQMTTEEISVFKSAEVEFSTANRVYCSNIQCGRFIPPSRVTADKADCSHCGSSTCAMCKNTFHRDDCAEDTALQATLDLATREGWQRCFACRAMVELRVGCYHMTCNCSAEFCYLCGLKWKNCSCDRYEDQILGARAEEIVDRDGNQPVQERQRRIVQMQEDLVETHECEHPGRFQRIITTRRHRCQLECEMCGVRHRRYILECRRCHLRVCEDCRRHRV
ncbi:hypothetical protein BDV28DRAFT_154931 [Aspergillus coremiiformis]|uniref:RBR-type E3 ubiquitin transferase n=1 Tax=Aspergillus coremiiformis TaxID=138285 RepID=A0A5N6ZF18_9EURO|nr:hypothetical protein BDV28DRAFT_154931 [Aspergillus coremiiformis]